ncbi:MAG: ATP-binding cassette domain-containing protein [Geminicoccaceae bacterium]
MIGRNGAGKTTTLRSVTGFTELSGRFRFDGHDLRAVPLARRPGSVSAMRLRTVACSPRVGRVGQDGGTWSCSEDRNRSAHTRRALPETGPGTCPPLRQCLAKTP